MLTVDFSISLIRRACFTPCQTHELLGTVVLAIRHRQKFKEIRKSTKLAKKDLAFARMPINKYSKSFNIEHSAHTNRKLQEVQ